ncbi:hypothetical protein BGZ75_006656 [Mortierella antarctica]|nr:hypothetical protein BGZ75_006656 [Mortierella antarctica]
MSSAVESTSTTPATEVEQVAPSLEDTANSITVDSGSVSKEEDEEEEEEAEQHEEEKIEHKDQQETKTMAPRADLAAELTFVQERLEAIAKEERTGADGEKVALEELGKSTEALISSHQLLSEKQTQLDLLSGDDSTRAEVESEVDQLKNDSVAKEHQWSATKEVYHREFGAITEDVTTAPLTEGKAKAAQDIKLLQDQIASLQKQLDAVSIRRKQMAADAEEQHRRLEQEGGALDDDDEVAV